MNSGERLARHLVRDGIGAKRIFLAAFPDMSETAIERSLSRGIREDRFESYRLYGATKYYVPTRKEMRAHGLDDERAGMAYGFQALCKQYAIAASCHLTDLPKVRLMAEEFTGRLSEVGKSLKHRRTRYFLDKTDRDLGVVRVGLFVVDMGQKIRNVVRKVRKEVERRQRGPFERLTKDGLFSICVLTGFEKKAVQIRAALKDLKVPVRVEAVPGYAELMVFKG